MRVPAILALVLCGASMPALAQSTVDRAPTPQAVSADAVRTIELRQYPYLGYLYAVQPYTRSGGACGDEVFTLTADTVQTCDGKLYAALERFDCISVNARWGVVLSRGGGPIGSPPAAVRRTSVVRCKQDPAAALQPIVGSLEQGYAQKGYDLVWAAGDEPSQPHLYGDRTSGIGVRWDYGEGPLDIPRGQPEQPVDTQQFRGQFYAVAPAEENADVAAIVQRGEIFFGCGYTTEPHTKAFTVDTTTYHLAWGAYRSCSTDPSPYGQILTSDQRWSDAAQRGHNLLWGQLRGNQEFPGPYFSMDSRTLGQRRPMESQVPTIQAPPGIPR